MYKKKGKILAKPPDYLYLRGNQTTQSPYVPT